MPEADPVPPPSETAPVSARSAGQNDHGPGNVRGNTHGKGNATSPLPDDWEIQTVEERWKERQSILYTEQKKTEPREEVAKEVAKIVKQYSDDMAGLFSAVLTAFSVQSYPLLSPSPPDPVHATLQQISLQLNSFSVNLPLVNTTQPVSPITAVPGAPSPERWAVVLNMLWFSSLIFSLSAASVAIMVKQWLAEYSTGISGSSPHISPIRQHRLNSLRRWRVAEIIGVLPVLLQIALSLFFAGILVLLWHLNHAVAAVATILIGVLLFLALVTIVLPAFSRDCCYISPPAIGFALAVLSLTRTLVRLFERTSHALPPGHWAAEAAIKVYNYMEFSNPSLTIRGKELRAVADGEKELDVDMATAAFTTTLEPRNITASMPIVTMLEPKHASCYFSQIKAELTRHEQWTNVEDQVPCRVLSSGLLAMAAIVEDSDYPLDSEVGDGSHSHFISHFTSLGHR
ncbi:hypothetical protein C8Q80DRAFT_1273563 [Daedaleopsis nitida]|nr:hypothetical protein C8Q80DRAFT_1273563 [Daedaleopsis nitida]